MRNLWELLASSSPKSVQVSRFGPDRGLLDWCSFWILLRGFWILALTTTRRRQRCPLLSAPYYYPGRCVGHWLLGLPASVVDYIRVYRLSGFVQFVFHMDQVHHQLPQPSLPRISTSTKCWVVNGGWIAFPAPQENRANGNGRTVRNILEVRLQGSGCARLNVILGLQRNQSTYIRQAPKQVLFMCLEPWGKPKKVRLTHVRPQSRCCLYTWSPGVRVWRSSPCKPSGLS